MKKERKREKRKEGKREDSVVTLLVPSNEPRRNICIFYLRLVRPHGPASQSQMSLVLVANVILSSRCIMGDKRKWDLGIVLTDRI